MKRKRGGFRFDYVQVTVKDWAKMVEYYRDTFGLNPIFLEPEHRFGWLKAGRAKLAVRGVVRKPDRLGVSIHFRVKNIVKAISDLEARGVKFIDKQLRATERFQVAYFLDPEGNVVSIWSEP